MDAQIAMGKAPARIAHVAKKYDKMVIAIAGSVSDDVEKCHEAGIDAVFPTIRAPMSIQDAMRNDIAEENVKRTAYEIMRLIERSHV